MKSGSRLVRVVVSWTFWMASMDAEAYWLKVLWDDFSSGSSAWTYAGVSNAYNQPLIACDSVNQKVRAEWDQSNVFIGTGDPYTIVPSRLSRPLDRVLTDRDTVRFGVTLNIEAGTVVDTIELFQMANVALCDITQMGPDRPMSDNGSDNSNLLRDGSDFVEFSYFVNNGWGGPNITSLIGAHIDGVNGDYTTGVNFSQTAMGEGHWLPEGTNLYVQVEYFGAATGALARVAHCAIYTEPARTNVLVVNGVAMSYWTQSLPTDKFFRLTDLAFYNYPSANWGGANGAGAGTFDDVYVERYFENGKIFSCSFQDTQMAMSWAAESDATYYVEFSTNLCANVWMTNAVLKASGETATYTNFISGMRGYYRVSH